MVVGDAERQIAFAKRLQDVVIVPAPVPELEGIAVPARQHLQKRNETLAIFLKLRRQLKQHRSDLGCQGAEAGLHQRKGVIALIGQPLPMGDEFRRFPRKPEIRGRIVAPGLDRLQGWRAVERASDLGGGKARGIKAQPVSATLARRIKRPSPAVIRPA